MSNARSPREVCSTTIGTSGLIVLASVSLPRPDSFRRRRVATLPPWRESSNVSPRAVSERGLQAGVSEPGVQSLPARSPACSPAALAPCPASTASRAPGPARPGSAWRCSASRSTRLARGEVLAQRVEAARLAQALEQLLRRRCPRARPRARAPRAAPPRWARSPRPRRPRRARPRGAARARRRARPPSTISSSVLARDLQVGLARDALVGERVDSRSHISRARASTSASGTSIVRLRHGGVERGLAELGLDACSSASRRRWRMSSRSSSSVSKPAASAAKSSSSSGSCLRLDLLDGDRERARSCRQLLGAVVVGEGELDRALLAGARRPRAAPRSRGSGGRSRARPAGRGPRRPRTARRRCVPT